MCKQTFKVWIYAHYAGKGGGNAGTMAYPIFNIAIITLFLIYFKEKYFLYIYIFNITLFAEFESQ